MRYMNCMVLALMFVIAGIAMKGETQEPQTGIMGSTLNFLDQQALQAYHDADYDTALTKWKLGLNLVEGFSRGPCHPPGDRQPPGRRD